jgi:hypothetical protein
MKVVSYLETLILSFVLYLMFFRYSVNTYMALGGGDLVALVMHLPVFLSFTAGVLFIYFSFRYRNYVKKAFVVQSISFFLSLPAIINYLFIFFACDLPNSPCI